MRKHFFLLLLRDRLNLTLCGSRVALILQVPEAACAIDFHRDR